MAIPETAAGNVLRAWLDAYNKGDSASVAAFLSRYHAPGLRGAFEFRPRTGGFDLLSIEVSEPLHIEFMIRNRNSPFVSYGALDLTPGDTTRVGSVSQPLGPNVSAGALRIDAAGRARVIDRAAALLDSFYVLPGVGRRMRDSLHARLARGGYDRYLNGAGFSIRLNADLDQLAHDGHLRSHVHLAPGDGEVPPPPTPEEAARAQRMATSPTAGFGR